MAATRTLVILVAFPVAIAWAVVAGAVTAWNWAPVAAEIAQERDNGIQDCASLYSDAKSRDRCAILPQTLYEHELAEAIFTRLLVAAGPLAGVGLYAWFARRHARPKSRQETRSRR